MACLSITPRSDEQKRDDRLHRDEQVKGFGEWLKEQTARNEVIDRVARLRADSDMRIDVC